MNFDDPDSSTDFDTILDMNEDPDGGGFPGLDEMLRVQEMNAAKFPMLRERLYLHAKEAMKFGTI